jgi:hypothetical protein
VKTWLLRIVVNCTRSAASREAGLRRRVPKRSPGQTTDSTDPGRGCPRPRRGRRRRRTRIFAEELARPARACLDRLPTPKRQTVVLRAVEGLTAEPVCSTLGISDGNLRALLHRGGPGFEACWMPRWGRAEPVLYRRRRALVCRHAIELMSDYLHGALSERDRARLEAHLSDCPHCSEYLAQLRAPSMPWARRRRRTCPTRRSMIWSSCTGGGEPADRLRVPAATPVWTESVTRLFQVGTRRLAGYLLATARRSPPPSAASAELTPRISPEGVPGTQTARVLYRRVGVLILSRRCLLEMLHPARHFRGRAEGIGQDPDADLRVRPGAVSSAEPSCDE